MKFKHKPRPKHGDIRYKVFFAWLPITIGLETRWLEKVSVKQIYIQRKILPTELPSRWEDSEFEQQPLPDYRNYNRMKYPPPPPRQQPRVIKEGVPPKQKNRLQL